MATGTSGPSFPQGAGILSGRFTLVSGTGTFGPLASPVGYASGVTGSFTVVGRTDGYHVAGADNLIVGYDVVLGTATEIEIEIQGAYADPDTAGGLVPLGANPWFTLELAALDAASDEIDPVHESISITADRRRMIALTTIPDFVRFRARGNVASATTGIALGFATARKNV